MPGMMVDLKLDVIFRLQAAFPERFMTRTSGYVWHASEVAWTF